MTRIALEKRSGQEPRGEDSRGFRRDIKRVLLGNPIATARLKHERLGNPTALAVFSSDAMSSVAYATEEILRVLIPVAGVAAFSFVLPISMVIALILVILILSYRQTIREYPSAGGAYIVTKDNFGVMPAQVAGVALLTDYVLTVAVSTAAGVQALTSILPSLHPYRVPIALGFVWLIAYINLFGVRESGRIFSVPTYMFIGSMLLLIVTGASKVLAGDVTAVTSHPPGALSIGTQAAGVFLILKAFASGGAALTGVEAISNGIPAFKKPEWRNAQITLGWMGVVLGTSFLGISFLAHRLHVVPVADESKSVLSQIGRAIYGHGVMGNLMFLILQVSTTLILVLAANTSFADFPRLANFQASDAFLPRQFTKRGHRLVFSNGIIALAGAASVLLIAFRASVTALIPLYALGVYTSFTLSQAGMARHHLRKKERGWRRGLLINGSGAVATSVVLVVIAVVKFEDGAWMIMVAVPILVYLLTRVNRTYEREDEELLLGLDGLRDEPAARQIAVVLVNGFGPRTLYALGYGISVCPGAVRAVHLQVDTKVAEALRREWAARGPDVPLEILPCAGGDRGSCLAAYVRAVTSEGTEVTVIVPGASSVSRWQRLVHGRSWSGLVEHLRDISGTRLVVVRHDESGGPVEPREGERIKLVAKPRHRVLILVEKLDRSVLKAVRYARSIEALEVTALHIAVDPVSADRLLNQWWDIGHILDVPLDVHECPDRNIPRVVKEFIDLLSEDGSEVTIVMPRREYESFPQRILHDRTSRSIANLVRFEPHVDLVVVPYKLGQGFQGLDLAPHESSARSTNQGS